MTKKALPEPIPAQDTLAALAKRLRKDGYKKVGSGAFAAVWAKGDVAIKVALDDPGYDLWLEECLKNQDNPYFPKIFDVKRFSNVKKARTHNYTCNATVVSMERLRTDEVKYADEQLGVRFGWQRKRTSEDKQENALLTSLNHIEAERGWLDIHPENILFRGDQPVITDPVA